MISLSSQTQLNSSAHLSKARGVWMYLLELSKAGRYAFMCHLNPSKEF